MPIYEYACQKCGKVVEVFQKATDRSPGKHEKCGGKLARVLSNTSFQLKGGGWYKDLYASAKPDSGSGDDGAGSGAAGESAKAKDAPAETKVEAKAEAKPEAKSDAKSEAAAKVESPKAKPAKAKRAAK